MDRRIREAPSPTTKRRSAVVDAGPLARGGERVRGDDLVLADLPGGDARQEDVATAAVDRQVVRVKGPRIDSGIIHVRDGDGGGLRRAGDVGRGHQRRGGRSRVGRDVKGRPVVGFPGSERRRLRRGRSVFEREADSRRALPQCLADVGRDVPGVPHLPEHRRAAQRRGVGRGPGVPGDGAAGGAGAGGRARAFDPRGVGDAVDGDGVGHRPGDGLGAGHGDHRAANAAGGGLEGDVEGDMGDEPAPPDWPTRRVGSVPKFSEAAAGSVAEVST